MELLAGLSTGGIIGIVVAAVVVLALIIWLIATYNSLITGRNSVDVAASDMDVYLKKRYDLIPNLVETVKGYAKHESGVLTAVTEARAKGQRASSTEEKIAAANEMSRALRSFNALAENYPELKADSNFRQLQASLSSIEGEIANSRRYYNAKAGNYNARILKIPTNIIAKLFGFKSKPLYNVDDPAERENVKVAF